MPKNDQKNSRRSFITNVTKGVIGASMIPSIVTAKDRQRHIEELIRTPQRFSANDQVQIALIGSGGMGVADATTCRTVPGVKLVAVCDLYDGRLAEAKKRWGNDIYTTRDYKEILDRKDIDAVIVATPDFWHRDISVAAMNKGKHVYCEKPMVHKIEEGLGVIKAQKASNKIMQVGSQRVSRCYRNVIENTKTHGARAFGVVTRRAYITKNRIGFAAHNHIHG